MQDLNGKYALVAGLANKRSIAFAVARELADLGAHVGVTYLPMGRSGEAEKMEKLAKEAGAELVLPLDVGDEGSMTALGESLQSEWGKLHVLVHSIAGAKRGELAGEFSSITAEGYRIAHEISGYSLISLVRQCRPLMTGRGASVLTLTYIGSVRTTPNYNVMGSAKAGLEANVRYLAMELGREGIRVNALSAGPIRTLAASGIKDFLDLMHNAKANSALGRNVELAEVGRAAAFLASDASSGITGQVIYVDGGFNISG